MSDQDRIDQLATQVRRLRWMNYGMAAVIAAGAMLAAGTAGARSSVSSLEAIAKAMRVGASSSSESLGGALYEIRKLLKDIENDVDSIRRDMPD